MTPERFHYGFLVSILPLNVFPVPAEIRIRDSFTDGQHSPWRYADSRGRWGKGRIVYSGCGYGQMDDPAGIEARVPRRLLEWLTEKEKNRLRRACTVPGIRETFFCPLTIAAVGV